MEFISMDLVSEISPTIIKRKLICTYSCLYVN